MLIFNYSFFTHIHFYTFKLIRDPILLGKEGSADVCSNDCQACGFFLSVVRQYYIIPRGNCNVKYTILKH